MTQTLKISPLTRVEGHLDIELDITKPGTQFQVVRARSSGTMFRGFENILKGRDPRDAAQVTQRICGVCPQDHAMASVLALEDASAQLFACRQVVDKALSVRNTEKLVTKMKERPPRTQRHLEDPDLKALQEEMLKVLGTKVLISGSRTKGVLKIFYFSLDDLNRIYDRVKGASS